MCALDLASFKVPDGMNNADAAAIRIIYQTSHMVDFRTFVRVKRPWFCAGTRVG